MEFPVLSAEQLRTRTYNPKGIKSNEAVINCSQTVQFLISKTFWWTCKMQVKRFFQYS